jgi:hypothetical protein
MDTELSSVRVSNWIGGRKSKNAINRAAAGHLSKKRMTEYQRFHAQSLKMNEVARPA